MPQVQYGDRHQMHGAYPVRLRPLGTGDRAIEKTVQYMKDMIRNSSKDWTVRKSSVDAVSSIPEGDHLGEVQAIVDWVNRRFPYRRDPHGTELLQGPGVALALYYSGETPGLDCDDKTMLTLSMAKSIGHPVGLRVVSTRPDGRFNHVYGLIQVGGMVIPVDAVRRDRGIGWETPRKTRHYDRWI